MKLNSIFIVIIALWSFCNSSKLINCGCDEGKNEQNDLIAKNNFECWCDASLEYRYSCDVQGIFFFIFLFFFLFLFSMAKSIFFEKKKCFVKKIQHRTKSLLFINIFFRICIILVLLFLFYFFFF